MRILTFLNVSNRSRMQADSGYIFYNLLSPYFTKQNSFYFASPEPLSDIHHTVCVIKGDCIIHCAENTGHKRN